MAPTVLNRNFTPAEPNQVLTSDITYIWTDEGWLYLAVTLDLFNREVVGWSVKPRMTADLVTDALTCVSYYTSLRRSETTSGWRRRQDSLMPIAFRGASLPGGSYRHSFLSL